MKIERHGSITLLIAETDAEFERLVELTNPDDWQLHGPRTVAADTNVIAPILEDLKRDVEQQ